LTNYTKGLEFCFKVAHILKDKNPDRLFKIEKNSIVAFKTKSRLCSNTGLGGSYAHFHQLKPARICIIQKALINFLSRDCTYENGRRVRFTTRELKGNFALIQLMCHELAHHRTKGHTKKWHEKYYFFLGQMALSLISGDFYK